MNRTSLSHMSQVGFLAGSVLLLPAVASATTTTWGGSNNTWTTPGNWSNGLPAAGNDGIINSGNPQANGDLPGGETITLNSPASLQITSDLTPNFTLNGGIVHFVYSKNLSGAINVTADTSVTTSFNGTFSGAGSTISGANRLLFTVNAGGIIILSDNGSAWSGGLTVQSGQVNITVASSAGTGTTQINSAGIFTYLYTNNFTATNNISGTGKVKVDQYDHTVNFHGTTLSPGDTPGTAGTLTLDSNGDKSIFSYSVNGAQNAKLALDLNSASSYDQLNNLGRVNLNHLDLAASLNYAPSNSDKLFILTNDGTDAIAGTFTGLAEGATVTLGSATAKITYLADSTTSSLTGGNDVALYNFSSVPEPATLSLLAVASVAIIMPRRRK